MDGWGEHGGVPTPIYKEAVHDRERGGGVHSTNLVFCLETQALDKRTES